MDVDVSVDIEPHPKVLNRLRRRTGSYVLEFFFGHRDSGKDLVGLVL